MTQPPARHSPDQPEGEESPLSASTALPQRPLPPAARRALAEAEERRKLADAKTASENKPTEKGGPKGEEPTRFGDWERKGRAVDF